MIVCSSELPYDPEFCSTRFPKFRGGSYKMIPELKKETVRMKNPDHVSRVIQEMATAGNRRLQVAADFDFTLSRFYDDKGNICDSTYRAFEQSSTMPAGYRAEAKALLAHYYPIEVEPNMTIQQKIPHMIEWWTKSLQLMVNCNIRKDDILAILRESNMQFRQGCDWMFTRLHELGVPLLIFSAGIGDIILVALQERSRYYDNMHIISNFMDFNNEGVVVGFKGEMVHVFNKNEHSIRNSQYFTDLAARDCIILLGDSLGDLRITEGAINCQHLLRIGFLNDKIDERLNEYMNEFDLVLVNDQTMDVPNAILKHVAGLKTIET